MVTDIITTMAMTIHMIIITTTPIPIPIIRSDRAR